MGLVAKFAAASVGAAVLAAAARTAYKNLQETNRRKASPLRFDEGITQSEFIEMANTARERTPRLADVAVSGMAVAIQVRSNSGLSTWDAELDFNDYGHLTGKYWIDTRNSQSIVPKHFADELKGQIEARLTRTRQSGSVDGVDGVG